MKIHPDEHDKAFGSLLHSFLVCEENGHSVDSTATALGITTHALYSYCYGDRPFPAKHLATLVNHTGETRFFDFYLRQCGLVAYKKPTAQAQPFAVIESALVSAQKECNDAFGTTLAALIDNIIDHAELADINKEIDEAQAELEKLRAQLALKAKRSTANG